MDPQLPLQPAKRKVFISLSTVVLLCLLCLIGAAIFGWWGYRSRFTDSARLNRERVALSNQLHRAEIERHRGNEEARLALARSRQTDALTKIRAATNILGQLLLEAAAIALDAAALKTNQTGQLAAFHPELVAFAGQFYEREFRELPSTVDIVEKLEGMRRLELQLISAQGTAYEPETSLFVTTETASQWANDRLRKTAHLRSLLSTIEQDAKAKFTTETVSPSSLTLEEALQKSAQAEATMRQAIILQQSSIAKTNATETVAQAEADRIIAEAKLEAKKLKRETEEAQAELARRQVTEAAESKLKDAQTGVAAEQKLDESARVILRQKASEPEIQSRLAPFITPGYMDAYGRTMVNRKPHSYLVLKSSGTLEPTMAGLQKVADLAYTRIDKVRPRWTFQKFNARGWRYNPEEMEMVKETQRLLAELGPVLVEMGLLEP